jgi:quercetin dioxygenase-like cupin family protein
MLTIARHRQAGRAALLAGDLDAAFDELWTARGLERDLDRLGAEARAQLPADSETETDLAPLARALGTSVDALLAGEPQPDPRVRRRARTVNGTRVLPLSREGGGGPRAYHLTFPERGEPEPRSHEGHDWLYVLAGRMRVLLGEHDVVLRPGEVAEFDTRTPHWLGNPFDEPAEVLGLFGPQGERMHVRARPKSA